MTELLRITEYTDPACPWAWGSEPKFRWLRGVLAEVGLGQGVVSWRRVYGILFDEGEPPAPLAGGVGEGAGAGAAGVCAGAGGMVRPVSRAMSQIGRAHV